MKIKNLTVALLVIAVILTNNSALGCCIPWLDRECTLATLQCKLTGNCSPARRTLDPMQDEERGFFDTAPFGSLFRKLSSAFGPGIQKESIC